MFTVSFVTTKDVIKARKKLENVHNDFSGGSRDAIYDFAKCLSGKLQRGTALDFLKACDEASRDILDPKKVPEAYDIPTSSFVYMEASFLAENLFGKDFAREVKSFMDVRELV